MDGFCLSDPSGIKDKGYHLSSMHLTLVIHSILCVLGLLGGGMLTVASVISIANMKVPWVTALLVAAVLLPVMFLASGLGAWMAYHGHCFRLTLALVAWPWVYTAGFVTAMWFSFDS